MLVPGVMDRWWEDASNYQLEITIPAWLVVIIPLGELFFFSSALTVLEDNFSKSGSPALIALMMNEDRHISGSCCRRLTTPRRRRALWVRGAWECAHTSRTLCPRATVVMMKTIVQKNKWKFTTLVYVFSFFQILECKLLISIYILCVWEQAGEFSYKIDHL